MMTVEPVARRIPHRRLSTPVSGQPKDSAVPGSPLQREVPPRPPGSVISQDEVAVTFDPGIVLDRHSDRRYR